VSQVKNCIQIQIHSVTIVFDAQPIYVDKYYNMRDLESLGVWDKGDMQISHLY
jgi:hypothetical protein